MNDLSKYTDYIIQCAYKVISYTEYISEQNGWNQKKDDKNRLRTKKLERLCGHTTEQRKK